MEKDDFNKLRGKAENELKNHKWDDSFSEADKEKLIHDLQVQKIELEMQNEELRDTKAQLEQSRDHFSLLFNSSPEGIVTLDQHGVVIESNNTLSDMLNLAKENILHKTFTTFIHPKNQSVFMSRYKAFFKSPAGKSIELELVGKDKTIYVQLSAVKMPASIHQKVDGLLINITDFSDRKRAEEELLFQNILMKTQQEVSLDGILIVDEHDKIISFNKRFADIWEIPDSIMSLQSSEKALQYVLPKLTNPDEFATRIRDLYKNKQEESYEEIALTDGKILERYSSPMFGSNDEYYGRIWYYRDITDRKEAEKEIQKQLTEKETLLREVHHRVKNNICNIEGLLTLQSDSTANSEVQTALQDTISRVQSMRVLYDKLLLDTDYHNVSVREYTESLIDALVEVFAAGKNVNIDMQIDDFRAATKVVIPMGIIINELLTNVFKYAFKGRGGGRVSITITKSGSTADLIIHDNGIGIDEKIELNESPGFGLTIVQMLADQLQGSYSITNDNGTKSIIRFGI